MHEITLGEKIRIFRKRAKLSQFDLELELAASPGSICRIEKGKVNPTKETLMAIAKVLNLNTLETIYLFSIEIDLVFIEAILREEKS